MSVISDVLRYGIEAIFRRYYGLYRGEVVDTADPEQRGRVRVKVPAVMDEAPDDYWFEPAFAGAGAERGLFWPPEIGDTVRVSFEYGDTSRPGIYVGGWFGSENGKSKVPSALGYSEGLPDRRGFRTRGGHVLVLDDTPGKESIRLVWHKMDANDPAKKDRKLTANVDQGAIAALSFLDDGSIVLTAPNGDTVALNQKDNVVQVIHRVGEESSVSLTLRDSGFLVHDQSGNYLSMENGDATIATSKDISLISGGNITLKGNVVLGSEAGEPVALGARLLAWLASHTHSVTSPAPGSPTSPPLTAAALPSIKSAKVKAG